METKVEVKIEKDVQENRPSYIKFGNIYGKGVFKTERRSTISNFAEMKERAESNGEPFLTRNPKRYCVNLVDIMSITPTPTIDGGIEITLNKDMKDSAGNSLEIHCNLSKDKFTKEVTTETIAEAINKSAEGKSVYFASGKKLLEEVNRANLKEREKLESLRKLVDSLIEQIDKRIETNETTVEEYYRQLNGSKCTKVVVEETVEEVVED